MTDKDWSRQEPRAQTKRSKSWFDSDLRVERGTVCNSAHCSPVNYGIPTMTYVARPAFGVNIESIIAKCCYDIATGDKRRPTVASERTPAFPARHARLPSARRGGPLDTIRRVR
ncbi:unnamed protein product, partial [Iphiclides podalirius]